MKNIYILSDKKIQGAKNLPVFEINFIRQNIDFKNFDALIFTSKNAIYSIDSFDDKWKDIPSFAIAPQTAKIIKQLNGNLQFVGKKNHGNEFALELIELLKNKTVLYLRGSKIVSKLVDILNDNNIKCEEVIIYETICKKLPKNTVLPKNSTIIFSSPSTIKCFLDNLSWDQSYKAISIGKTTASYFPSYIAPTISDTTSLQSCVKKALEI